jgi:hypothetical protein
VGHGTRVSGLVPPHRRHPVTDAPARRNLGKPSPGNPNPGNPYPGGSAPGKPNPGNPNPGNPNPGGSAPGNPNPGNPAPGKPNPGKPNPVHNHPGSPAPGRRRPALGRGPDDRGRSLRPDLDRGTSPRRHLPGRPVDRSGSRGSPRAHRHIPPRSRT